MIRSVEIGYDALGPVKEVLKDPDWKYDLVVLGRSVKPLGRARLASIGGAKGD